MFCVPHQYRNITDSQLGSDASYGNNGAFNFYYKETEILTIASDGMGWEHVSVSLPGKKKCPSWEIMCYVKNTFWDSGDIIVQFHPPKSKYINQHEYCLHLWRPIGKEIPIPDSILVGIK